MNIDIIYVGTLKESYWKDASEEYIKRLKSYCKLEMIQIKEAPLPKNASPADEEAVKNIEGKAILNKIKKKSYIIALDIPGKEFSSESFASNLSKIANDGNSKIVFIIGGSLGLSNEVLKQSNQRLSFSRMTFPHQLMRVILLEQIYRAFKINKGEVYHK